MSRLKDLFKKTTNVQEPETEESKVPGEETPGSENTPSVPEGLWVKCPKCGELLYKEDVVKNDYVCPKCKGYFRIKAKTRIRMVADKGSFQEWCTGLHTFNPLDYPEYEEKIAEQQEKTHLEEAIRIGEARIDGTRVVLGVLSLIHI